MASPSLLESLTSLCENDRPSDDVFHHITRAPVIQKYTLSTAHRVIREMLHLDMYHLLVLLLLCSSELRAEGEHTSTESDVRLVGGASRCAGTLELKHKGEWRPVSGNGWTLKTAAAACRELDCGSAVSVEERKESSFRSVWWIRSNCVESGSALRECASSSYSSSSILYLTYSDPSDPSDPSAPPDPSDPSDPSDPPDPSPDPSSAPPDPPDPSYPPDPSPDPSSAPPDPSDPSAPPDPPDPSPDPSSAPSAPSAPPDPPDPSPDPSSAPSDPSDPPDPSPDPSSAPPDPSAPSAPPDPPDPSPDPSSAPPDPSDPPHPSDPPDPSPDPSSAPPDPSDPSAPPDPSPDPSDLSDSLDPSDPSTRRPFIIGVVVFSLTLLLVITALYFYCKASRGQKPDRQKNIELYENNLGVPEAGGGLTDEDGAQGAE